MWTQKRTRTMSVEQQWHHREKKHPSHFAKPSEVAKFVISCAECVAAKRRKRKPATKYEWNNENNSFKRNALAHTQRTDSRDNELEKQFLSFFFCCSSFSSLCSRIVETNNLIAQYIFGFAFSTEKNSHFAS